MTGKRFKLIDILRGIALLAMTLFHFVFDLEMFGVLDAGTSLQSPWKPFARGIASSFLLLVGFSVYLAYLEKGGRKALLKSHSWRRRTGLIIVAALVITLATYFATPDAFIFFGILHHIAIASLLALLFLSLPFWLNFCLAIGAFMLPKIILFEGLIGMHGWWTGLASAKPKSSDFVPIFPWFSAVLLGIAIAQLLKSQGGLERLALYQPKNFLANGLAWLGRHSLVYYLLHQPILIAFIWLGLQFT